MQIKLDTSADALYIKLKRGKVHRTVENGNSLIDLDKKGGIIGIEVLNYSKEVPLKSERASISVGDKRILLPA